MNTFNHVEVTVDPEWRATDVGLKLDSVNKQATFDGGDFTYDLQHSPEDVKLFGYNLFNGGNHGEPDTTPIKWYKKPNGKEKELLDFQAYRLSLLLRKPIVVDNSWLARTVGNAIYGYLNSNIVKAYNDLIASPWILDGLRVKDWYNNQNGKNFVKLQSQVYGGVFANFLETGWLTYDTSALDTTDVAGPARGISPSALGRPSLEFEPKIRWRSLSDIRTYFSGVPNDLTNIEYIGRVIKSIDLFKVKYDPDSAIHMDLATSFGLDKDSKWGIDKSTIGLAYDLKIDNHVPLQDPPFQLKVKVDYFLLDQKFDKPAINLEIKIPWRP